MAQSGILIGDGRFWGEADMHSHVTWIALAVDDPTATSAGRFCCDAQQPSQATM
jgi:hypothetical protein